MRTAGNMTRQNLADKIGISLDALRKIERGTNGAKIDTLVSIAELFHISLDYLVCGCEKEVEIDSFLTGLSDMEVQFVRNMVQNMVQNMILLRK